VITGEEKRMTLQFGDIAPDFIADTTDGRIAFHQWAMSSWVVLFSHPRDFTPVCTTEFGQLAKIKPQFDQRNVKIIGLSIDTNPSHLRWAEDIRLATGHAPNFPIIADFDRSIAQLYGMIHPLHDEVFTVRTVFVIDPRRRVRLTLTYPQSCGRNFQELLRVIDSLQLTDQHSVATPADWRSGLNVIIPPSITEEETRAKFPAGWHTVTPYLRYTPDPRVF
jgi:alkyl hydroperoxide reductase subunit AhpC